MGFEITGKVALITGGATGIGLCHSKELLRQGLKGVIIADVNEVAGKNALEEIEQEFGANKVLFVKTDVASKEDFEGAFEKTLEKFGNIDILINNAGILNDGIWEREIDINIKGTINGIVLGLENYLRNNKQGEEAVIVNTASVGAVVAQPLCPVYGATNFANMGLSKCWGLPFHYERTNVRVVGVCPGVTNTALYQDSSSLILPEYEKVAYYPMETLGLNGQKPEHVAKEVARIIKFAGNGTVWIVENSEPAYEFTLTERETFKENILRED